MKELITITVPLEAVDYDYSVHGKAITITASSEIVDYDYTDHEKADYDYITDFRNSRLHWPWKSWYDLQTFSRDRLQWQLQVSWEAV